MGLSERIMSLAGVRRNSTNVVFRIDTLGDIVLWSAGRGWQCYLTETVIFMPNNRLRSASRSPDRGRPRRMFHPDTSKRGSDLNEGQNERGEPPRTGDGSPLGRLERGELPQRTRRTLALLGGERHLVVDRVEDVLRQLLSGLDLAVPGAPADVRLARSIRKDL